jgi:hypothetical protein
VQVLGRPLGGAESPGGHDEAEEGKNADTTRAHLEPPTRASERRLDTECSG